MKVFLIRLFLSLSLIWILVRGAFYLIPGSPALYLAHESLIPLSELQMESALGLNQTFLQRIFSLPKLHSLTHSVNLSEMVLLAAKNTFFLGSVSFGIALFLTVILLFVVFQFPRLNQKIKLSTTLTGAIPLPVLGTCLIIAFCIKIPLFSITKSIYLPAFCLGLHLCTVWFRTLESQLHLFLPLSAVNGARARGIPEIHVFFRYLFIPLAGSIASFLGSELGTLLSGSVLIELIFQWNGLGALLLQSVHERDYPLIEITLLLITLVTISSQQLGYWAQRHLQGNRTS